MGSFPSNLASRCSSRKRSLTNVSCSSNQLLGQGQPASSGASFEAPFHHLRHPAHQPHAVPRTAEPQRSPSAPCARTLATELASSRLSHWSGQGRISTLARRHATTSHLPGEPASTTPHLRALDKRPMHKEKYPSSRQAATQLHPARPRIDHTELSTRSQCHHHCRRLSQSQHRTTALGTLDVAFARNVRPCAWRTLWGPPSPLRAEPCLP